jgi:hypothetical protein
MTRARDASRLITTPPNIYATDSEASAGFLSLSSASSTYVTQNNASFAGKNKIINGGFDIWQRGTSFTGFGTVAYTADRWLAVSNTATYTVTRQTSSTSDPVGSKYFARVTATVAGNFDCTFGQPFESTVFDSLKGKTVTLSFYAKASTALTVNAFLNRNTSEGKVYYYEGTIINNTAFSLSTSWNRYSVTFTMPDKSVTSQGLQLSFQTAMTLNQYYDIWGVQLEEGSIATNFVPTGGGSQQEELAQCQRYYHKSFPPTVTPASSYTSTRLELQGARHQVADVVGFRSQTLFFPVEMRVNPTLTFYNGSTDSTTTLRLFSNNNQTQDLSGHGAYAPDVRSFYISFYTGVTVGTSGLSCMVFFNYTASAEL